jgi:hypothetical protein
MTSAKAWLLLLTIAASLPAVAAASPSDPTDRSRELLKLNCKNTFRRREVTLFANGTIRLRDGRLGDEALGLLELGPDELDGVVRRLGAEDLGPTDRPIGGPLGDWVERCQLDLELKTRPLQIFHFGRYDALSLALGHIIKIADDLGDRVKDLQASDRLPNDYTATPGDVLQRFDGQLYRVIRYTDDTKAVELEGVIQPFELFVPVGEMKNEFKVLVSRKP